MDWVEEKDRVVDSGLRGEEVANNINDLLADSARSLASRLSDAEYKELVETEKGAEILIVDPEIAAKYTQ